MPEPRNLPELLAPAGNPAMLHAALSAGADAAYLGMGEFNARRSAENFDDETFASACDYAHLRGARIYVAMNTIVLPDELSRAVDCARTCANAGADAFIVQDLGLALALKRALPDARLHASTQMSIHSEDGIRALADLGFARVTLARELSLAEIGALAELAANLGLEVEAFAHGALCVCYSGQCLMSSMIGGRSANRGLCAQACRLPYRLVDMRDPDRQLKSPGDHLLSPKDLRLAGSVDELARAGVASLKVEGRMKSPEYVNTVVSVYREALDALGGSAQSAPSDFDARLGSVFSRGFTTAYLDGRRGNDVMSYQRPNNRGQFVGRVKSAGPDFLEVACEKPLVEGDLLEVWTRRGNFTVKVEAPLQAKGKTFRLKLPDESAPDGFAEDAPADDGGARGMHSGGRSASSAPRQGKAKGKSKSASLARPNDRVFRVRSAEAAFVDDEREPRIPVRGKATLRIGEPLKVAFWPVDDGSPSASRLIGRLGSAEVAVEVEGEAVEAARTRAVSAEDVVEHIDRMGQTPYSLVGLEVDMDEGVGIGFSQLHHIRAEALDLLTEAILGKVAATPAHAEAQPAGTHSAGLATGGSHSRPAGTHPADAHLAQPSPSHKASPPSDIRIAVVATNPECARAAKRAGAHDILVSALNYKRGQSQTEGVLASEPSQAPFPKHCTIMLPAIAHDAKGTSREALLGEDVWSNVSEGQAVYVEGLGALHRAQRMGCTPEIGSGLPLVNREALPLAQAFGVSRVWLSPELNMAQVAELARPSAAEPLRIGVKVAGAQELMVTEHCMLMSQGECSERCQTCTRRRVPHALEDRKGYFFPVVTDALGRSHIYNSVELDNVASVPELVQAGVTDFMIDATLMSPEKCAQATGRLSKAIEVFLRDGNSISKLPNTTTGHLYRGVR